MQDHSRLRHGVAPGGQMAETEPRGGVARRHLRSGQNQPRARQAAVQAISVAQRLAERRGEEGAIVEQHGKGGRDHDLLARHAHRTRDDRSGVPAAPADQTVAADDAVQRQKVEESHQRFGALDDVGDALGLQRVDHPDQCRCQCEPPCRAAVRVLEARSRQRAVDDTAEHQRREHVHGQVERVVTPDVQATQRVVDRQREVRERAAFDRTMRRWRERLPRRPEPADVRVVRDRADVVEDEWSGETVVVDREADDDEHQRRDDVLRLQPGGAARDTAFRSCAAVSPNSFTRMNRHFPDGPGSARSGDAVASLAALGKPSSDLVGRGVCGGTPWKVRPEA